MHLLVSGATATVRQLLPSPFLGHLLVPGAGNCLHSLRSTGLPWAVDNAAFTGFDPAAFCKLLGRVAGQPGCLFAACPDVVGDAVATLALFPTWQALLTQLGLPVALVGQDGLETLDVPWGQFQTLFLGGTTDWKLSAAAADLAREAKRRGCQVHLGRCNSRRRLEYAYRLGCDSVDGSGFSRWPEQRLRQAAVWLAELHGAADAPSGAGAGAWLPTARQVGVEMLDLPGWVVDKVERSKGAFRLTVRYTLEPVACPWCGARGGRPPWHRHGRRQHRVRDLPRHGQRVILMVLRRRYRCRECHRSFVQPLPDLAAGHGMTQRLAGYLMERSALEPASALARAVGVHEKTVRLLIREKAWTDAPVREHDTRRHHFSSPSSSIPA